MISIKVPVISHDDYEEVEYRNGKIYQFAQSERDWIIKLGLGCFYDLEPIKQVELIKYCLVAFVPVRARCNTSTTSYGMKRVFEGNNVDSDDLPIMGFKVPEKAFKAAMLLTGHVPEDVSQLHWDFRVLNGSYGMGPNKKMEKYAFKPDSIADELSNNVYEIRSQVLKGKLRGMDEVRQA